MALASTRTDREHLKFDLNSNQEHAVRTLPDVELLGDGIDSSQLVKVTPTFFHVPTILANTEYSQALAIDTKAICVRPQIPCRMKIYYSSGSITYLTVGLGGHYFRENLKLNGVTIYFQSSRAGNIIEIEQWT